MRTLRLNEDAIIKKEEAAKIILRLYGDIPEKIYNGMLEKMMALNTEKFIKEFRKCTGLKLKNFGNDNFQLG